jgi:hypothetical protein
MLNRKNKPLKKSKEENSMRMKYSCMVFLSFILLGMAAIAQAEDINGEWVIEEKASKANTVKTIFEFEAHGSALSGSRLGYPESETPILDGKINGDKITFSIKEYSGERSLTYMYVGKISGDIIKFSVVALVGHGIPPGKKYIAKRVVSQTSGK